MLLSACGGGGTGGGTGGGDNSKTSDTSTKSIDPYLGKWQSDACSENDIVTVGEGHTRTYWNYSLEFKKVVTDPSAATFEMVYRFYRNNQCNDKDLVYKITKTGEGGVSHKFEDTEGISRIGVNRLDYRGTRSLRRPNNKTVVGDYLLYSEAKLRYRVPGAVKGSGESMRSISPDERVSIERGTLSKIEDGKMTWTWWNGDNTGDLPGFLEDNEVATETFTKVK